MEEVQKQIKEIKDNLDNREKEFTKIIEENENQKNELQNQKKELKNQEKKMQNEIDQLKNQIKELQSFKQKYLKLKGRFIYKSFYDYILLIFGIPIEESYKKKETLFESQLKLYNIQSKKFEFLINDMKNSYLNQSGESHWIPEEKKIEKYLLSIYNEYEEDQERDERKLLKRFFETSHPEKEIIELMKKNNEFILNNNSDKDHQTKDNEKIRINGEINNLLNNKRKQELLENIKEIVSKFN